MIAINKNTLLTSSFTGGNSPSQAAERRLRERTFFHDILNTAGGMQGFAEMLNEADVEEIEEYKELIVQLSSKLLDEVKAYQQFTAAEENELEAMEEEFSSEDFLGHIVDSFKKKEVGMDCQIKIVSNSGDMDLSADKSLLQRVLFILLKNAMEASDYENPITLGCTKAGGYVQFQVHNQEYVQEEEQGRIFQKGFSIKGSGRGYGTYTTKRLVEDYLHGFVTFESTRERGTTFKVSIPTENSQNLSSAHLVNDLAVAV